MIHAALATRASPWRTASFSSGSGIRDVLLGEQFGKGEETVTQSSPVGRDPEVGWFYILDTDTWQEFNP
jgi:hypothetical protein